MGDVAGTRSAASGARGNSRRRPEAPASHYESDLDGFGRLQDRDAMRYEARSSPTTWHRARHDDERLLATQWVGSACRCQSHVGSSVSVVRTEQRREHPSLRVRNASDPARPRTVSADCSSCAVDHTTRRTSRSLPPNATVYAGAPRSPSGPRGRGVPGVVAFPHRLGTESPSDSWRSNAGAE